MPTDTVYGIAASADRPDAIARIYAAKSREGDKPIPLLAADTGTVLGAGIAMNEVERRLAEVFWPGPLTLVLDAGGGRTEGCRVPAHGLLRLLLKRCGGLLRVTSANISADPPALSAEEALETLGDSVDLVIDAGKVKGGVASSVVRVDKGKIRILREGALGIEELTRVAG